LEVLHALVDSGNTVLVIEHNLEVIKTADWIIDLGPEGGDAGGHIVATGKTLYILDEPTTGLHFEDTRKLLEVLHELTDSGNTVVVIEHNLDVIKTADWLLDFGPEGGDGGGEIVAFGTPEQVAANDKSWTGKYLKGMLARHRTRHLEPAE
jgi:excinuclease ABC subunit A